MTYPWCNRTWTIQGANFGAGGNAGFEPEVRFSLNPIYSPNGLIGVYAEFDAVSGPKGWKWCVLSLRKGADKYVLPKKLPRWDPNDKDLYEAEISAYLGSWGTAPDDGPDVMMGLLCLEVDEPGKGRKLAYDFVQLYALPEAREGDTKSVLIAVVEAIKMGEGKALRAPPIVPRFPLQSGTAHGDD